MHTETKVEMTEQQIREGYRAYTARRRACTTEDEVRAAYQAYLDLNHSRAGSFEQLSQFERYQQLAHEYEEQLRAKKEMFECDGTSFQQAALPFA